MADLFDAYIICCAYTEYFDETGYQQLDNSYNFRIGNFYCWTYVGCVNNAAVDVDGNFLLSGEKV